jgi:glycosyltransferase involved in cell wall biosynthesis
MKILELAFSGTIGTVKMGPVSTDICELANHFSERGHDVTVADCTGDAPRSLLRPEIRVVEIAVTPLARVVRSSRNPVVVAWRRWSTCLRYVHLAATNLNLRGFDVVHLHDPEVAFLLQRMQRIVICYTAHTPLWSLRRNSDAPLRPARRFAAIRALNGRLNNWVERSVLQQARTPVGLGSYLQVAVPGARVRDIPNGLALEQWTPVDRIAARRTLGISERAFVATFAGRIGYVKGVDVLLTAVRACTGVIPELQVNIIGPLSGSYDTRDENIEPYAKAVMELSKGLPVRFLGFISNRELEFRQHLAAADVFVVPSRVEPQGKVVLESLAMGTPVIATATGGIPDMVSPEVGFLCAPGDAEALAACLRDAHQHPAKLANMRAAARSRVEQHFTWKAVADRYLAAFVCDATKRTVAAGAAANLVAEE